jgi:hypothetical protein
VIVKEELKIEYLEYVEANSKDGYSKGVVDYTERWANLMESGVDFQQASHDADIDGITGFMYDCAVQCLSKFWVRGDELLKWHNRKHMHDDVKADEATAKGGVVSTSIFNIEV